MQKEAWQWEGGWISLCLFCFEKKKERRDNPLTVLCGIIRGGKAFKIYHPKCLFLKFLVMNGNPLGKRETLKCLNSFSFFAKVHARNFSICLHVHMFFV